MPDDSTTCIYIHSITTCHVNVKCVIYTLESMQVAIDLGSYLCYIADFQVYTGPV